MLSLIQGVCRRFAWPCVPVWLIHQMLECDQAFVDLLTPSMQYFNVLINSGWGIATYFGDREYSNKRLTELPRSLLDLNRVGGRICWECNADFRCWEGANVFVFVPLAALGRAFWGLLDKGVPPGGAKGIPWQDKGWGCQSYRGFHGASLNCEQDGAVFEHS